MKLAQYAGLFLVTLLCVTSVQAVENAEADELCMYNARELKKFAAARDSGATREEQLSKALQSYKDNDTGKFDDIDYYEQAVSDALDIVYDYPDMTPDQAYESRYTTCMMVFESDSK